MKMNRVIAVYFSPTGISKKVAEEIAHCAANELEVPFAVYDFTLPEAQEDEMDFGRSDLVVFGTPVYAGRVPNKILPEIRRMFRGNDALAVPVVTFGNRSYDNALIELRNELEAKGFHTIAGGAFAAEHVFSEKLAEGRPDHEDMKMIRAFGKDIADKAARLEQPPGPIKVKGIEPVPPYYQPLGMDGRPAVFLKARPKITDACIQCGKCLHVCPMGSISNHDGWKVEGICIKCQACIKACPVGAIYFDDPAFLSHVAMLEQNYRRKAENEIFIT